MCGIVGYLGPRKAVPILLEGLHRLEYRGYDSAGISILTEDGGLATVKEAGKIAALEEVLKGLGGTSQCGIGHTRWATHGAPNKPNAHPHVSMDESIALVHNGIIENAQILRSQLEKLGYRFRSDTDTEVLVHLVDEAFKENENLEDAVAAALLQVEGAYGIAVVSSRDPDKIVAARNGSPLLLGIGKEGEFLVGSDAAALVSYTRDVVYLNDGDVAVLNGHGYSTFHLQRGLVNRPIQKITWDLGAIEKGGNHGWASGYNQGQLPDSLRFIANQLAVRRGVSGLGGLLGGDRDK